MKKTLLSLTVVLTMISCSNNDETLDIKQDQDLLTKKEINSKIKTSLEETGDFKWMSQDAHTIWSAVNHGENILTIGYGTSKNNYAKSEESTNIKNELLALVRSFEPTSAKGETELYVNENINVLDIKVTNKETINVLLKDNRVRYIEPGGYSFLESNAQAKSDSSGSSGCGYGTATLNTSDYRTVSPGARLPWSFDAHNISQAWNYSTGSGVTVAVVDSGLSPEQKWMNQYFNDGYSSGRTVQKYGTFVDSWWAWSNNYDGVNDKCGHGTKMAAVATAPRNNDNLPVGVAYNANLVTYRAVENVVIDDYHEKRGVVEALTALANRSDVKVISMSLGSPFSIGNVSDAVKYAHSKGKMILAAGGTSTSFTTWYGVIFPASMSETVAVTGVKEGQYSKCDVCHTGSQIDFTVQMQRTNGTDNKIPVLSYYDGQENYIGGSSVATATTAGIAALVWAKNPSWSREQVLQKMKESADFYPNKHSEFGYGNIDALKAVQ
ncbi:S8 family peptidase [Tenacibaculum larymnensis]|uniref:S8 family serine peptidase n=1 Tax=Tenacibaculum larymnensis TaxID=2878201 RepID=A0A9X4EMW8_9FLAO|nr:S8 family serine peptidase [Tenacibaculum larymnensis]MDE1206054.1 S8 family serine peptidase [Tenacibaculum larymnensis]